MNRHKWHAKSIRRNHRTIWYAAREIDRHGKRKVILMHREILSTDAEVDHKDRNGLNNRHVNLRPATHAQNIRNQRRIGLKGIKSRPNGKWQARIRVNKQYVHLGTFETSQAAADAYDAAALTYFGEFAAVNSLF